MRRILLLLLFMSFFGLANAQSVFRDLVFRDGVFNYAPYVTILPASSGSGVASSTDTQYNLPTGIGAAWGTTEGYYEGVIPAVVSIQDLYVTLSDAPGTGKSRTFVVRKNNVDTALTVTISNNEITGINSLIAVPYSPGDKIALKSVPTGTPTESRVYWGMTARSPENLSINMGNSRRVYDSTTPRNTRMWGNSDAHVSTVVDGRIAVAGRIRMSYFETTVAPNVTMDINLRRNSGNITGASIGASETTDSHDWDLLINAHDRVLWSVHKGAGTYASNTYLKYGWVFVPATPGISIFAGGAHGYTDFTDGDFTAINQSTSASVTESSHQSLVPIDCTVVALSTRLTTAPGEGHSRTFTVRKNGQDTALTVTTANTGTESNATGSIEFKAGDLISIKHTVSGTPATTGRLNLGIAFFKEP